MNASNLIPFILDEFRSPLFSGWVYAFLGLISGCHLYLLSLKESMTNSSATSSSLSTIAVGAWGVVNMGFGITLAALLVALRGTPDGKVLEHHDDENENTETIIHQAIGWGHTPLLLYLLQNYLGGQFRKAGFDTSHLVWLVVATALGTSNILQGWAGEPVLTIRALNLMLGAISFLFYVHPTTAAKLILGRDLRRSPRDRALVGAEHQYLLLHAFFNLCLVYSCSLGLAENAQRALGWTALLHVCSTMETVVLRQWHVSLFGIHRFSFQVIAMLSLLVTFGCWTIWRTL